METSAVLLVDDESTAREILTLVFEAAGFMVVTAEDGTVALDAVEEIAPDVVVTDIHMPRMSGQELARKLAERHGNRSPPVVAATADLGMVERLRGDGTFFAVLPKPINARALIATVRAAIGS